MVVNVVDVRYTDANGNVLEALSDTSLVGVVRELPELDFTKTVSGPDPAYPGDELVYTIRLRNPSDRAVNSVEILDTIPGALTILGADSTASVDGQIVRWAIGPLEPGDSIDLSVRTQVGPITERQSVLNRARLLSRNEPVLEAESPVTEALPEQDDEPTEVDLGLTKEVDRTSAGLGDRLTWTLSLQGDGYDPTTQRLVVVDTIPAEVDFVDESIRLGGTPLTAAADGDAATYNPATRELRIDIRDTLPDFGETITFSGDIRRDVPIGTLITNSAWAVLDAGSASETVSSQTTFTLVEAPDLRIQKSVSADTAVRGDTLVYTIIVENPSTDFTAYGIEVSDVVPGELVILSTSPQAVVDGQSVRWVADSLAPGATLQYVVTTLASLVDEDVPVINRAILRQNDQPEDTTSTEAVIVSPGIGLDIEKVVDRSVATIEDVLRYRLHLLADDLISTDRVTVVDTLPAELEWIPGSITLDDVPLTDAVDVDEASFDASTGVLTIVLENPPQVLDRVVYYEARIRADVPGGTRIFNRAHIRVDALLGAHDVESPTTETITELPDVIIRKTVEGENPATVGDTLLYTVEVQNPSTTLRALGLEVVDTLPDHLTLLETTPEATVEDRVVRWTIPTLDPGELRRFTLLAEAGLVEDSVSIANRAVLNGRDGRVGEALSDSTAIISPDTASIELQLESELLEVQIGQTLPLRVTLTNSGQATVKQLQVKLTIPDGTRFIPGQILQGVFLGARANPAEVGPEGGGPDPTDAQTANFFETPVTLDSFTVANDTLTVWIPGEMRTNEQFRFRYLLAVESAPPDGQLVTVAEAEGRRGTLQSVAIGRVVASQLTLANVILGRNRPLETRTTIGKIFFDANDNGRQDDGEPGVPNVDVWTEDGELVTSDADGKFSFENLRPGRHAFRLDPRSIRPDLRASGMGAERGLQVLETNGWTSGRLSFPLVSIRARVSDAQVPAGARPETCDALGGWLTEDAALSCAPTDDADLLALASELLELRAAQQAVAQADQPADEPEAVLAPLARVELTPDSTGWPDASFPLPPGWTVVPGSGQQNGEAADPEIIRAPDGTEWLQWRDLGDTPGPISVLLWEGEMPEAQVSAPVRVDPLRADTTRAAEVQNAFLFGPAILFQTPLDGAVVSTNRVFLGVEGEPLQQVALFRGDSLLSEGPLYPNGVGDFNAIDVEEGPNLFRIRMTNSWGQERWDSVTVHRSGVPVEFIPERSEVSLVADGLTSTRTRVRLLDRWGVPVAGGPLVTVRMDGGQILGEDADPSSFGHQLQADIGGWVTVEMRGGRDAGAGALVIENVDADVEIPLVLTPPIRPLLLTGVGQVSLGAGGQDFGAITARGRLDDRTSITLSYDTRKLDQGRDEFGRNSDPLGEGRYAILGDASEQRSLSASRYQFAARVERGLDWLMLGDVQTSGFSDGLTLGRYNRALPGAAGRITAGGVVFNGFGATTTQALRQTQFRGAGTSGPYELGTGILAGTERISVQTRAFDNPTRILSEQTLTRYVDYQIDYQRGVILTKQPIPAADPLGNPVFLMIGFEGESGGERSTVFGLRATGDVNRALGTMLDSIPLSVAIVNDNAVGNEFRMGTASLGLLQRNGIRITGELTWADGADSTDVATRVEATMPLFAGRVNVRGEWMKVGDEFRNPANLALRAGTEEMRASISATIRGTTVSLNHEQQGFRARELERSRTTVNVRQPLGSRVDLEARFAGDASTREGVDANSGGGEYKLTWRTTDRLSLFAEGRSQLWSEGQTGRNGSYVGAGATFRLSRKLALEARHTEVTPADGEGYATTSIGVTSDMRVGTRAWGSYQVIGGADGRTNAAVVGLNHKFGIGPSWRFSSLLERRRGVGAARIGDPILTSPFEQQEEDYLALGFGSEYVPQDKPYRLSFRVERKDGDAQQQQLGTLAGDVSFGSALAFLTRQEFVERDLISLGQERYTRQRSSLWGLAYRPTTNDELNVLFKFEWKDAINPFGTGLLASDGRESRLIGQLEAIWAPAANFEFGARFAARSSRQDAEPVGDVVPELKSQTQFVGATSRWEALPWLSAKLEARGLFSGLTSTSEWDVAPAAVFQPFNGIEIETGYRFGGLQDPDFAVKTGQGWYLTFGTRITELTLPNAAAFWRDRF